MSNYRDEVTWVCGCSFCVSPTGLEHFFRERPYTILVYKASAVGEPAILPFRSFADFAKDVCDHPDAWSFSAERTTYCAIRDEARTCWLRKTFHTDMLYLTWQHLDQPGLPSTL